MNDDSQLSAFLDDELDPDDLLMVAWNVESSPDAAQRLGDLKSVRDLVAGLGRPTIPVDLSAEILAAIEPRRRSPRSRLVRLGRTAAMTVGIGSLAACLLVAVAVLNRTLHDEPIAVTLNHPPQPPALQAALSPSRSIVAPPAAAPRPAAPAADLSPAQQPARGSEPAAQVAGPPVVARTPDRVVVQRDQAGKPEAARPAQLDAMLGQRKVLRALVVTDQLDRTAREVRALIEADTTRAPDFGRITLAQGIVVDPDQPGAAEVYAVVLSGSHVENFCQQLTHRFPNVRIEPELAAATITQLTRVGQAELVADTTARLGQPPREIRALEATKGHQTPEPFVAADLDAAHPGEFRTDPLAVARQTQLQPPPPADKRPDKARSKEPQPGLPPSRQAAMAAEPATVLVWITRSSRR